MTARLRAVARASRRLHEGVADWVWGEAASQPRNAVQSFLRELAVQRWDDHRFYHHSRINQSLHLLSALTFVVSYGLLFVEPAAAAILAWCVSMTSRQAGHFFFEPRGFDAVNQVTDAYKEEIKIGYNIRRKVVLMVVWAVIPVAAWAQPMLFGIAETGAQPRDYLEAIGLAWLALAVIGLVFRVLQLAMKRSLMTGIVWLCKILSDPFHDIWLYHRAPLHLLRGELIDPMWHARHR
jgi:hypothetical protein